MSQPEYRLETKIYLEDTDAQGIVYHANYLKYCERARTDMLGVAGHELGELQGRGLNFVVHEMHLKFHRPARLHDVLEVRSRAQRASSYRASFEQRIYLKGVEGALFSAEVQVVCVDPQGRLTELPSGLFA